MFNPGAFYMIGFQPERVEYGEDAVSHFDSLTDVDGIEVYCEYTGKSELKLIIGQSSAGPFVYAHDSNGNHGIMLDADKEKLFSTAVRFVQENQESVNSDPRDPSCFDPSLQPRDMAARINEQFGTSVEAL